MQSELGANPNLLLTQPSNTRSLTRQGSVLKDHHEDSMRCGSTEYTVHHSHLSLLLLCSGLGKELCVSYGKQQVCLTLRFYLPPSLDPKPQPGAEVSTGMTWVLCVMASTQWQSLSQQSFSCRIRKHVSRPYCVLDDRLQLPTLSHYLPFLSQVSWQALSYWKQYKSPGTYLSIMTVTQHV